MGRVVEDEVGTPEAKVAADPDGGVDTAVAGAPPGAVAAPGTRTAKTANEFRPKISGRYISWACVGATWYVPGDVARAT